MMTAVPYRFKVGQLVKFSFIESTLYKIENRYTDLSTGRIVYDIVDEQNNDMHFAINETLLSEAK